MLICSFSPIQKAFFCGITPSPPDHSIPAHQHLSSRLHLVVLERLLRHDSQMGKGKGPSWRASRGGLKGKRWTDNLVVWPTNACSCTEMITQSARQTSIPARPRVTARTDMGWSVCGPRDTAWLRVWTYLQHRAQQTNYLKEFPLEQ